jgi:predicted dehydrogenase
MTRFRVAVVGLGNAGYTLHLPALAGIADALVVGEATVRSHVSSISRKLQLASRTQAALRTPRRAGHNGSRRAGRLTPVSPRPS